MSGWFTFSFFSVWLCGSGETPERSAYTFSPYELKSVWELDHMHTYSTANGPQSKILWGRVTRRLLWRYLRRRANRRLFELKDLSVSASFMFSSPIKKLYYCCQTINHIQNKSFCLHNICMCTAFIYYVYINRHAFSIYFENIYMHIHLCIYIIIFYIIYKYIEYINNIFFLNIYMHVFVFIYT